MDGLNFMTQEAQPQLWLERKRDINNIDNAYVSIQVLKLLRIKNLGPRQYCILF